MKFGIDISKYQKGLSLERAKRNDCLAFRNYTADMIGGMGMDFRDADDFARFAIKFSDGVIVEEESLKPELKAFAEAEGKPVLDCDGSEDAPRRYDEFLGTLFED